MYSYEQTIPTVSSAIDRAALEAEVTYCITLPLPKEMSMEHDMVNSSVLLDNRLLFDRQMKFPGHQHGVCIGDSSIAVFSLGRKM